MNIKITKKVSNAIVVEGFPGFGLIGTIATEFLVDHLKCEKIGKAYIEELPSSVAIHEGKIVEPVGIYYSKKHNLVIVHSVTATAGIEWLAADIILEVCKQVKAKELVCLEGVGSSQQDGGRTFYYTNLKSREKCMKKTKVPNLTEGIIVGPTAALLMKATLPITCLFAETHTNLPDSKATAKIVGALNDCLNLKVDTKPLLKQAEKFEEKLKTLVEKGEEARDLQERKSLNYVG